MKTRMFLLLATLLLVALTACGNSAAPSAPSNEPAGPVPTATAGPVAGGSDEPAPAAVETPTPTQMVITHMLIPGEPAYLANQVIPECSTGSVYTEGHAVSLRSGCDLWQQSILERPASADLQTFFPHLDIAMAQFGSDAGWFYSKLMLFDGAQAPANLYYLIEIDSDLDARGDFLILVRDLPVNATAWTTNGVQIWEDTNDDVGAGTPVNPDPDAAGNGYDLLVFDAGSGSDPDLAWARRSPLTPNHVEFAFKPGLLAGVTQFGWWASAIQGTLDPAAFDLVDTSSRETAFELDNTCSLVYGGQQRGFDNQCILPEIPPTPVGCTPPPRPDPNIYGDMQFNWILCRWQPFN